MALDNGNKVDENVEKDKKQNNSNEKQLFLNDFYKNYELSNFDKNELLDDIFVKNKKPEKLINNQLKEDIESSNISGNKPKYKGLNLSNITLSDLKAKFGVEYILLKEKRDNLKSLILDEYNLSENEQNTLFNEVKKIDFDKLSDFINSNKKLNSFVKQTLGNDVFKFQIDNFPSLYSITEDEYNKKIKELNNSDKHIIENIFLGFKKGILDDTGIKELIRIDFLNNKQKKEIVEKLIPRISLKKIKELKLISNDELLKIENDLKIKYSDIFSELSDEEKNEIFKKIDLDNILINTSFILDDSNIKIISDKIGFYNIEDDFRKFKEEVKKERELDGPKDFEGFKKELSKLGIEGVDKLIEGESVLKITRKGDDIFEENYLKFDKLNNKDKSLSLSMVGSRNSIETKTKIDLNGEERENYNFSQLIDILKTKDDKIKVSLDILAKDDFKSIIEDDENFEVELEGFKRISKEELDNDEELKNKVKEELEENYRLELEELQDELSGLEEELKSVKNNNTLDSKDKNSQIEIFEIKIARIKSLIEDKEKELREIDSKNISTEKLVAYNNFKDLLEKINTIDAQGTKLGLKAGLILETKDSSYEIVGISKELEYDGKGNYNGETITLRNTFSGDETISYEAFFNAFKENKTKRIEKISTFDELLKENSWDEDYEVKNDGLVQKEVEFNGKKEEKNIDYLVSKKGDLIKIESIGDGRVDVVFGKYSEGKKDEETKKIKNKIALDKNIINLSLNELNKIIKDEEFSPDWRVGKNYTIENIDGYQNDIKGSFATRFWNKSSFKELMMSGKLIVDGIEEYFKKGNDIKAAEFALKWASFLPEEVEADFIAQTEMKAGEAMDKELTALGKIASGKAFNRVLGWLKNKDTAPHKIEAGLMLAAKYGVLYPKKLANYNGRFLWYEALGGKIGDEMYEEEKLKAEKSGLPFDEKELLISLLGAQSGGRLSPKRRSKFYKEFKGKIAGGFSEEYGDGYKDATDKRNVGDVVDGGMDEAIDGTLPNALGWAKRAVEKGGNLKEMNEIYFSLIFSGALLNAPGKVLEELKNHWSGEGNSMILAAFGSDLGGQKIFNKTVVNLSKDMEDLDPVKYKGMSNMAESIFSKSGNKSEKYSTKVKNAREFWNKYGDGLSRTLYMADGDKNDLEYAKTDKLIAFGKDDKYKQYYDFTKAWTAQGSAFKKDFMQDEVGGSGATGISNFDIIKQHFKFTASQTFADIDTILIIWPKIWGDVLATKEKIELDPDNAYKYKKYLNSKLREISAGLLSTLGKKLYDSLSDSDPAGKDLKSIGIDLSKFKDTSYEDVLNGNDGKDHIFENAVNNVVGGNISGKGGIGKSFLGDITNEVQDSVNNMMYNPDQENVA